MPTYEYECRGCGKTFEFFQSISEAPKTTCPACGEKSLSRLIGAGAGFLFKGSGFYITDYRSADYKAKAKAEVGGSSKKDGGTPSKAEGKASSGGSSSAARTKDSG